MYLRSRGCMLGWVVAKEKEGAQDRRDDDYVGGSGRGEGEWVEEMKGYR
jgi:hypothetical protein